MRRWKLASVLALAGMWAIVGLVAVDALRSGLVEAIFLAGMGVGIMLALTVTTIEELRRGAGE